MADADSVDSPLVATGAGGPQVINTFKLLSNETRLAILLALWETYDPFASDNTVSFAELRERVGVRHGEQFTYHLDKLVGHFVEKTDDGYELHETGHKLVQTVIAGTGIEKPKLRASEIEMACWKCGAPTEVVYGDTRVYTTCTECEGSFATPQPDHPHGMISAFWLDPAGLSNRSKEEIVTASILRGMYYYVLRMAGICPVCSGRVKSWFDICEDHDPGPHELCPNCRRDWKTEARWECSVCKHWGRAPPSSVAILHPTVVTFYEAHDIEIGYLSNDFERIRQFWNLMTAHEQELVSMDPPRICVMIHYEGDELQLTFDEEMNVVETRGPE